MENPWELSIGKVAPLRRVSNLIISETFIIPINRITSVIINEDAIKIYVEYDEKPFSLKQNESYKFTIDDMVKLMLDDSTQDTPHNLPQSAPMPVQTYYDDTPNSTKY